LSFSHDTASRQILIKKIFFILVLIEQKRERRIKTPLPESLSPTVWRGTLTPFPTVGEGLGLGCFFPKDYLI
jgi:hypothetical protein